MSLNWVGGGPVPLWPTTEDLLPQATVDRIAERAREGDERGRLPQESLEDLRHVGYFGLPVPREFEGGGATMLQSCSVQRRLGAADPGLAIATNMHLFSLGVLVEHWLRERDRSWLLLEAIASQQRLVASAFAEPGLGGSILRSNCVARPTKGGYLITGTKGPCSLVARSDLICLQVQRDDGGAESLMVALIPSTASGLRVERTWDTLGMRASESDTLHLDQCFIPDNLIFHRCPPGFDANEVFAAGLAWFCVTTTATYLGVVSTAISEVCAALQCSKLQYLDAVRAKLPSFQSALGDVMAGVLVLEAACAGLAELLDHRTNDPRELLPAVIALKHEAVETCTRVVAEAIELAGAQGYGRRGMLQRLWRDMQALRFHPPTRLASRQILGRWSLGQPFAFELHEQPLCPDPLADLVKQNC